MQRQQDEVDILAEKHCANQVCETKNNNNQKSLDKLSVYNSAVRREVHLLTPTTDSPLKTKLITYAARDTKIAARRPGSCFPFAIFSFMKI